ncbi:MAG: DUF1572 family protein [Saprospiraceae bacterium]|nr:DUF1572 family protein [Saprospiraceae bacterium]
MMPSYLTSVLVEFRYYKKLGERPLAQVSDKDLFWLESREENSIGVIVQHLAGNMKSRWTNIWEEDGEKKWRHRDREFHRIIKNREELLNAWEEGWQLLFKSLESCSEKDLEGLVYIRNQGHTLIEAINRQLAHYAYHIGQIVLLSKSYAKDDWQSLTIPLGESPKYNEKKFSEEKKRGHFTDDRM